MAVAAAEAEPAVAVAEAAVHIPWVEAEAEPAVRLDPDIPVATHFVDPAGVIAVSHPAAIQWWEGSTTALTDRVVQDSVVRDTAVRGICHHLHHHIIITITTMAEEDITMIRMSMYIPDQAHRYLLSLHF